MQVGPVEHVKGCCEAVRASAPLVSAPSRRWPLVGMRDGREIPCPALAEQQPYWKTKVVLVAAQLDHGPGPCGRRHRHLKALCQRCQLLHDWPEHRERMRLTLRRR